MSANYTYCDQCGKPNDPRGKFCHNCGARLGAPPAVTPTASGTPVLSTGSSSSSGCLKGCLITFLIVSCLGLAGITAAGLIYKEKIVTYVETFLDENPSLPRIISSSGGSSGTASANTVTSAVEGTVSAPNGATITVPAGAVPVTDDGSAGTMVFSIEEDHERTVTLDGAFAAVGPVYNLGPEGFVFNAPVLITLPIPDGVDPEQILGLTYYDAQAGSWKLVPGMVDAGAGIVSAETTHFSPWSVFGSCIGDTFGGCGYAESGRQWAAENGGWFKVRNTHSRGGGNYPGGQRKPMSTGYGVCVQSYNFDNPSAAWSWVEPVDWKVWARDGSTTKFWLPAGKYDLLEVIHLSEINMDPLYVPDYKTYWRPIGVHTLAPGQTIDFESISVSDIGDDYTEGRPPCWGEQTTSVGTGDVQITLSWSAYADIDLYVEDPAGDIVYYDNAVVPSGGQLDRDNTCGNFIQDRPENIFWPTGGTPTGSYKISVDYYGDCGSTGAVQWTVRTVIEGRVETYSGTLGAEGDNKQVTSFQIR